MKQSKYTQTQFPLIATVIFNGQCGMPVKFCGKSKGQTALGNVPLVLGVVKGETHIYCYSINS